MNIIANMRERVAQLNAEAGSNRYHLQLGVGIVETASGIPHTGWHSFVPSRGFLRQETAKAEEAARLVQESAAAAVAAEEAAVVKAAELEVEREKKKDHIEAAKAEVLGLA